MNVVDVTTFATDVPVNIFSSKHDDFDANMHFEEHGNGHEDIDDDGILENADIDVDTMLPTEFNSSSNLHEVMFSSHSSDNKVEDYEEAFGFSAVETLGTESTEDGRVSAETLITIVANTDEPEATGFLSTEDAEEIMGFNF